MGITISAFEKVISAHFEQCNSRSMPGANTDTFSLARRTV